MEKKTVNVSDLLIKSIFIGLIIGILIVFIVHFFGSWSYQSARAGTYSTNTTMPGYYLNCPLDKTHYFKGKGETYDDFFKGGDVNSLNSLKFGAIKALGEVRKCIIKPKALIF